MIYGALTTALFAVVGATVSMPSTAFAYIDPGSGSLVVQALLAAGLGATAVAKSYWHKITSLFYSKSDTSIPDDERRNGQHH